MKKLVLISLLFVFAGSAWADENKDDGAIAIEEACLDGGCFNKFENRSRTLGFDDKKLAVFGPDKGEKQSEKGDGRARTESQKSKDE